MARDYVGSKQGSPLAWKAEGICILRYFPAPGRDAMGLSYHSIHTTVKYLTFPGRRGLAEQTVSSVRFGTEISWKSLS